MSIKKVTQHPSQNEELIFDRSQTGRVGYSLPKLDVEETNIDEIIPAELRRDDDLEGVPEVSEVDVIRHFTRISTWNYSIDLGMYPLGSCTMKYNSRLNEKTARIAGFTGLHPLAPEQESQGALELTYRLQEDLAEITGLPGVSLQPAAGAQGEMTGVMMIRAFLDKRDDEASKDRRVMLVPDSAHGTNPASAALAGFKVKTIKSTDEGLTDMEHLKTLCDEGGIAGLMLTNPNTVGIFEKNITEICDVIHDAGGLVYMDGANMNALVGVARPGDFGVDVIHLNLHKTFSTPHGGGGPGCGPCCCTAELETVFADSARGQRRRKVQIGLQSSRINRARQSILRQLRNDDSCFELHLYARRHGFERSDRSGGLERALFGAQTRRRFRQTVLPATRCTKSSFRIKNNLGKAFTHWILPSV